MKFLSLKNNNTLEIQQYAKVIDQLSSRAYSSDDPNALLKLACCHGLTISKNTVFAVMAGLGVSYERLKALQSYTGSMSDLDKAVFDELTDCVLIPPGRSSTWSEKSYPKVAKAILGILLGGSRFSDRLKSQNEFSFLNYCSVEKFYECRKAPPSVLQTLAYLAWKGKQSAENGYGVERVWRIALAEFGIKSSSRIVDGKQWDVVVDGRNGIVLLGESSANSSTGSNISNKAKALDGILIPDGAKYVVLIGGTAWDDRKGDLYLMKRHADQTFYFTMDGIGEWVLYVSKLVGKQLSYEDVSSVVAKLVSEHCV